MDVCSCVWSSQGSGGIPLARKLCYAVGGVPNQITTIAMSVSLQIFLLDIVQVIFVFFLQYHPVYFSEFQNKASHYITDGGLLCVHDFICEPGLGCCHRPSAWISGGPQ